MSRGWSTTTTPSTSSTNRVLNVPRAASSRNFSAVIRLTVASMATARIRRAPRPSAPTISPMPEGDTIRRAARRIDAALVGKPIVAIETPQRRHALDRWPQRLEGRAVRAVDAHGKHLFIRFEGDLTLHSHLRMTGAWAVYRRGQRWRRAPRRAWLVL